MSVDAARAVADAVLYEGYLLYPYRASAAKNRSRWQFGVLGPPAAASPAFAEEPAMAMRCLLPSAVRAGSVTIHLRFLQLQAREVLDADCRPVPSLRFGDVTVLTWDEAVEHELIFGVPLDSSTPPNEYDFPVLVPGGVDEEPLGDDGLIVRRRWPLTARVGVTVEADGELTRLTVAVTNEHPDAVTSKDEAIRHSLLGAHLLLEAHGATFVSMQDPPAFAADAAARCQQERCWPVLAGSATLLLGAPIILYDNPAVAAQSPGALFDATEIDEILTLRVMTMTDEEKAEARATDPRARTIVDRCDTLSPGELQQLHGTRLDDSPWWDPADDSPRPDADPPRWDPADDSPRPDATDPPRWDPRPDATDPLGDPADDSPEPEADPPWWDPAGDEPGPDSVLINGVRVGKGSLVRVHPNRRADAQDLFFAGQVARVTAVVSDVDGGTHVALVLVDDPAADLHDWYGRYFYFAPDEVEPLEEA